MRRTAAAHERISLFPFLAVLICTMGALLVLLVVIAKRAQAMATAERDAQKDLAPADLAARESLLKEIQQLKSLRSKASDNLARRRHVLAHIEDHMRRVAEQIRNIQQLIGALQNPDQKTNTEPEKLRAELARLEQQKAEAEKLLEEMLMDRETPKSYSIIPYHGDSGTMRRPVYLECCAEGVIFQPEQIMLTEADFARPLGPENPLASGLRALSTYLRDHLVVDGSGPIDPYPLLLVRPSGIAAYYAARAALRSWDADFGYELVEEDWTLDFPVSDPMLTRVTLEAIEIARPRHRFLVSQARQAERLERRGRSQAGLGRMVDHGHGDDGRGFGGGIGRGGYGPQRDQIASMHGSDIDRNRSALRSVEAARAAADQNGTNSDAGSAPSGASHASSRKSQTAARGGTQPGGSQEKMPGQSTGISLQFGGKQHKPAADDCIADIRGDDWALPGASGGSIPFERPMRVECSRTQLTLFPSDPRETPRRILFEGDTQQVIEHFVSTIWSHMQTWGIAGRGLYWKPVLNLYVHPGGERRAAELEVLLERSGLEIQQK
jgi:hypothetical protein